MSAELLLSRLDKVRKTGANTWRSLCPSHANTRSLTLSIRDGDDGRTLVKCHAGCSIDEVLGAVGLTINDLFERRLAYNHSSMRRPFPALDVLKCVASEATVVATAACNVRAGISLSDDDHERLLVAHERIHEAKRLACGER